MWKPKFLFSVHRLHLPCRIVLGVFSPKKTNKCYKNIFLKEGMNVNTRKARIYIQGKQKYTSLLTNNIYSLRSRKIWKLSRFFLTCKYLALKSLYIGIFIGPLKSNCQTFKQSFQFVHTVQQIQTKVIYWYLGKLLTKIRCYGNLFRIDNPPSLLQLFTCKVLHVTCHMAHVTFHIFF